MAFGRRQRDKRQDWESQAVASEQPPRPPTIAIYQNPDHVAGILQQLHLAPLVTDESREHESGATASNRTEKARRGGARAGGAVPFLGQAGIDASSDRARIAETGLSSNAKTVQNFTYSQAYYLLQVREALAQRDLLRKVTSAGDAETLSSGDFVEFQATFRPNSLHALLDILTPDLIAALTQHQVKSEGLKKFPHYTSIEELKVFSETVMFRAQIQAEIARAAAEAIRVDFRAEKTREFYGNISDVTAVTICDNTHFVVEDEDRILDGSFTVLGKVTSGVNAT